jgi:hypothetical protein
MISARVASTSFLASGKASSIKLTAAMGCSIEIGFGLSLHPRQRRQKKNGRSKMEIAFHDRLFLIGFQ